MPLERDKSEKKIHPLKRIVFVHKADVLLNKSYKEDKEIVLLKAEDKPHFSYSEKILSFAVPFIVI